MAATPAAADTLPGRDTPFTPSQAAAAQYTTPTPTTPSSPLPEASPAVQGETIPGGPHCNVPQPARAVVANHECGREAAADEAPGGTAPAEESGGTAPAADGPAVAPLGAGATTSPPEARGTLPFTGGDLLALVWIALALVALGTVAEVVRRRFEARGA